MQSEAVAQHVATREDDEEHDEQHDAELEDAVRQRVIHAVIGVRHKKARLGALMRSCARGFTETLQVKCQHGHARLDFKIRATRISKLFRSVKCWLRTGKPILAPRPASPWPILRRCRKAP